MLKISGFSLIEVLVSLFLLSLIVLGFAATEIHALHTQRAAYNFNIAINQLQEMIECLRVLHGKKEITSLVASWNQQNQQVLPQGWGAVEGNDSVYIITIYWGKRVENCLHNTLGVSGCIKEEINI
jgi:prepilin-type N-terminal cleavage/methylation domain-containing protein